MLKYRRRYLEEREMRRRWLDPRLFKVHPADVRAYMLSKGWKEVPPDRDGFFVLREPNADPEHPLYQFVPDFEDEEAYHSLIYELIAALASIEDRYAGDVLTDILRCQGPAEANGASHEQSPAEAVRR